MLLQWKENHSGTKKRRQRYFNMTFVRNLGQVKISFINNSNNSMYKHLSQDSNYFISKTTHPNEAD